MLAPTKDVIGYELKADDGKVGEVFDLYFDDRDWVIRYLAVDTHGRLRHRRVLISPVSVNWSGRNGRHLPVLLTKDLVARSPDVKFGLPLARKEEGVLVAYYRWPCYWEPGEATEGEPGLHSQRELIGCLVMADGVVVGQVEYAFADAHEWVIRYLAVSVQGPRPGRRVLVSPDWIMEVDWEKHRLTADLSCSAIDRCPDLAPGSPVSRDYEVRLCAHYGRPGYWESHVPAVRGRGDGECHL